MENNSNNLMPNIADFGDMLANAAQCYDTVSSDNDQMDAGATADSVLDTLAGLTEELSASYLDAADLCALMRIVTEYALTSTAKDKHETTTRASKALSELVKIWSLVKDYRPTLWHFTNAANEYSRKQNEARRAKHNEGRPKGQ